MRFTMRRRLIAYKPNKYYGLSLDDYYFQRARATRRQLRSDITMGEFLAAGGYCLDRVTEEDELWTEGGGLLQPNTPFKQAMAALQFLFPEYTPSPIPQVPVRR